MRTLLGYEIKKIVMKKSTLVAFIILFALQIFLAFAGSFGSTYVDGVFYETHAECNRIDRENGIALSGRSMDDALLAEMQEAYAKIDWSTPAYMWTDTYKDEVRKYSDLELRFRAWGLDNDYSFGNITEEVLYDLREKSRDGMWESYELSDQEKAYWLEKDTEVEVPFTYEYATAYESVVEMQGSYMTCMLLTFFVAISMVTIFSDEHTRKTDQLILCARYGRRKAYFAKILAGSIVVLVANLFFSLVTIVGNFFSYGMEGFGAAIQAVLAPWYSYSLSMGQTLLISMGLLFLSSIMVAIFAMLLAEGLRSSIGAMAVVVGLLFAARMIPISPSFGVLSQVWNYLPINLLKVDEGFLDLRLVNLFGLQLTSWQFAPILYVVIIVALVFAGGKVYKNYQVSGR